MSLSQQQGFSLLELLVALFVVVMIISVVSLNLDSGGRDMELRSQLEYVGDSMAFALDEAQMQGTDFGLLLQRDAAAREVEYRFSWRQHDSNQWGETLSESEAFTDIVFPPWVEVALELEGAVVDDLSTEDDQTAPAPQLVMYASGEITPGALEVRARDSGDLLWRLKWDLLGRASLLPKGIDPEDDDNE